MILRNSTLSISQFHTMILKNDTPDPLSIIHRMNFEICFEIKKSQNP